MKEFLIRQGVDEKLLNEVDKFIKFYKIDNEIEYRIPNPKYKYYGYLTFVDNISKYKF